MTLLEQFKVFAAAKPRDERYNGHDAQNCAVAQFAKSIDPQFHKAGFSFYVRKNGSLVDISGDRLRTNYNRTLAWSDTWGEVADGLSKL